MPGVRPRVLIVEDVPSLAQTYAAFLTRGAFDVAIAVCGREALVCADAGHVHPPDAILLDISLPDMTGLEVLRELRGAGYPGEVIVATSHGSINLAVEAMREGAYDFLVKPFTADRLRDAVRGAIGRRTSSYAITGGAHEDAGAAGGHLVGGFIGNSPSMQAVYRAIRQAAPSKATVFITGESGTGKEVCASTLHALSKRAAGPFVAVNSAAIPRDLLESELFGHVKGAFTGATADRLGAALLADGGTLFLDEICEMDLSFQAKMLRFLETGTVRRVGEDRPRTCDVRIVCATNRDPHAEVAAGRFREDLFYRLHVIPLEMPPLRARGDDVLTLARHFLAEMGREDGKTFGAIDPAAEAALLAHVWPGNVRELRNVIRKTVVMARGGNVELSDLPAEISAGAPNASGWPEGAGAAPVIRPLEDEIDRLIERAVALSGGSIPKAAAELRVSPSTLYRRLNGRGRRRPESSG